MSKNALGERAGDYVNNYTRVERSTLQHKYGRHWSYVETFVKRYLTYGNAAMKPQTRF
jgi:hypothetical protein